MNELKEESDYLSSDCKSILKQLEEMEVKDKHLHMQL